MTDVFKLIEDNGLTLHGDIEHFAALVRADERDRAMRENAYVLAEREECAKVLDEMADRMVADMEPSTAIAWVRNRAEVIRARGQA